MSEIHFILPRYKFKLYMLSVLLCFNFESPMLIATHITYLSAVTLYMKSVGYNCWGNYQSIKKISS